MSLSGALSNALTGLNAASWGAQIVSSNLANATTDGYGRRSLDLSALSADQRGGVRVDAVMRHVNAGLLADERQARAELAHREADQRTRATLETQLGLPGDARGLQDRVAQLQARLVAAASQPESDLRLGQVLDAARDVAVGLSTASAKTQDLRHEADRDIAAMIGRLNDGLARVAGLNAQITAGRAAGQSTAALEDARQAAVDSISDIAPLRVLDRPHGRIALMTDGGALILDGKAPHFGFDARGLVTVEMSIADGQLSGVTRNGEAIPQATLLSQFSGGALAAQFALRDEILPDAQRKLDALAFDLATRFQSADADPTLGPGDAGVFTDAGVPADMANIKGLSGRIAINPLADPDAGGALWRLRSGLGAAAPGAPGDATRLDALAQALSRVLPPSDPSLGTMSGGFAAQVGDVLSGLNSDRHRQDSLVAQSRTRLDALREMRAADGVDTDAEMQRLLLVEQSYQANARVISVVDDLLETLTRI